jgi:hypothetical protein
LGEALELIVELNGKEFDITEMEIEAAYEAYKRVDDFSMMNGVMTND